MAPGHAGVALGGAYGHLVCSHRHARRTHGILRNFSTVRPLQSVGEIVRKESPVMLLRRSHTLRGIVAASSLLTLLSASLAAYAQSEPPDEALPVPEAVVPASAGDSAASNPGDDTIESAPGNSIQNPVEGTVEEVLVTGEQPGPGLWKVSSGEHTLWILGTYTPLPKKFKWRSKGVEALIAESQELLTSGSVDADANIGFFKALTLLPAALAVRKNPDGKTLQEVLPSEVYAKWLEVKKKYIGNDRGIEKFRPLFAALELTREALKKSGLTNENEVWPIVQKTAKKNKITITDPVVHIDFRIEKPRDKLKQFAKAQLADIECFSNTINTLDSELDAMRQRANAWAVGDIEAIERLNQAREGENCVQMLITALIAGGDLTDDSGINDFVRKMRAELEQAQKDMNEKWFAAVDHALANNTTLFAVMSVGELVRADGRLAKLKEKGYSVDPP